MSEREDFADWRNQINRTPSPNEQDAFHGGWQAHARIAQQQKAELVEALKAYREQAKNADGSVTMPVCPSCATHDQMLEALAKHEQENRDGER